MVLPHCSSLVGKRYLKKVLIGTFQKNVNDLLEFYRYGVRDSHVQYLNDLVVRMRVDSWTLLQKTQTKIIRLKQVNGPYVKIVSHQWWINQSFISPLCSPSGFVPCDNKLVIKKRNVFFTCLQRILFEEFFCLKLSSKIINIKRQSAFESSFPLLDLHASAFSLKIRSLDFSRNIYETFPARYLLTTTQNTKFHIHLKKQELGWNFIQSQNRILGPYSCKAFFDSTFIPMNFSNLSARFKDMWMNRTTLDLENITIRRKVA